MLREVRTALIFSASGTSKRFRLRLIGPFISTVEYVFFSFFQNKDTTLFLSTTALNTNILGGWNTSMRSVKLHCTAVPEEGVNMTIGNFLSAEWVYSSWTPLCWVYIIVEQPSSECEYILEHPSYYQDRLAMKTVLLFRVAFLGPKRVLSYCSLFNINPCPAK